MQVHSRGVIVSFLILVVMTIGLASPSGAQIRLVTEIYPPFNFQDREGRVTGVSTDIVREMMHRSKIDYSISVLPWKRAYLQALSQRDTCVYSTAETAERRDKFLWVGPIISNDWVLFARKGRFNGPLRLDDAMKYRIGGYPGDAITQFLQEEGVAVDVTGKDESNLRKLMADRIDLWPSGLVIGEYRAGQEGAEIEPVTTLKSVSVGLACNKGMDNGVIAILRDHLLAMSEDGTLIRIRAAWGGVGNDVQDPGQG